ncbi:MAG: hypothetical protein ACP6IY_03700 [Promethearchaeia archaeon]
MSKSISYYDWELVFNKPGEIKKVEKPIVNKKKRVNSIGLDRNIFKKYLEVWTKKNL